MLRLGSTPLLVTAAFVLIAVAVLVPPAIHLALPIGAFGIAALILISRPRNRAWRWAAVAGMVYFALILVLLFPMMGAVQNVLGLAIILIVGAVVMAILVNRFFLTIGARSTVARSGGG